MTEHDLCWMDEARFIDVQAWQCAMLRQLGADLDRIWLAEHELLMHRVAAWPRVYTVSAPRAKHAGRRKARRAMAFARRHTTTRIRTNLPTEWATA
ncbi:hypothetical protein CAL26_09910 [Bordetella genomosp. 9]|uniref:Uncharacterized protein n=1 Tax=Bordetella genomosp. 9 TaxID=1416803 RepID=A0A261RFB9_9BORD|nr:hypothetical protein [Bordetella genomosp. 9]OZI23736.1 hypothetical protein CAL26_09910 [Bordetella genomosp. 9]